MTRILAYEVVSAGGLTGDPAEASLMPQGEAMRDALVHDLRQLPGLQVSVADSAAAPIDTGDGLQALHTLRARPGQTPLGFLAEHAPTHDLVWVIAPETDGLLLHAQEGVGPKRWVGSDATALRIASSKQLTLICTAAAGCRTPLDPTLTAPKQRWVVKPDTGAGTVDTWVLDDREAARALADERRAAGRTMTVQPWIEGEAMSVSLLCHRDRAELLSLNRQHITVDPFGQVGYAGVQRLSCGPADPRWPALQALAEQVKRALPGLRGFVGVDLVWHPQHGPVLIEVNARMTCAWVGLSAALGVNLAAQVLA